tara:strand:- start:377 stop:670 length:294 start_codon:yes stop_codon:yes gene_type:complete
MQNKTKSSNLLNTTHTFNYFFAETTTTSEVTTVSKTTVASTNTAEPATTEEISTTEVTVTTPQGTSKETTSRITTVSQSPTSGRYIVLSKHIKYSFD